MTMAPIALRRSLLLALTLLVATLGAATPAGAQDGTATSPTQSSDPVPTDGSGEPGDAPDSTDTDTVPADAEEDEDAGADEEGVESTASRRRTRKLGSRRLHEGMRGQDVRRLQRKLTGLRLRTRVSGEFGRKTKKQVKRFERWRNMNANGEVGLDQADKIKRLFRQGVHYQRHKFPIRGAHDYGGSGSRFGAPRSGHTHQGQDMSAAEGTKLVAVHEGRVTARQYQAGGAGYYLVIRGKDDTDSVYMHMMGPAKVAAGEKVMAGQRIGRVGTTGSSTGPHLHFELWTPNWYAGGRAFDPLQKLQRWDRRS